jgi:hypothetical protein
LSRLSRVNFAAVGAHAQLFVLIKLVKQRRQVGDDALQKNFRAMNQVMAFAAVPFEGVFGAFGTWNFDDQADRAGGKTLRRMARVFRKQKDFSLFDGDFDGRFSGLLHHADENVALQLVEKFLGGIVVIIHALVWPADYRDDDIAVVPHLGIAHGRF